MYVIQITNFGLIFWTIFFSLMLNLWYNVRADWFINMIAQLSQKQREFHRTLWEVKDLSDHHSTSGLNVKLSLQIKWDAFDCMNWRTNAIIVHEIQWKLFQRFRLKIYKPVILCAKCYRMNWLFPFQSAQPIDNRFESSYWGKIPILLLQLWLDLKKNAW